MKKKKDQKLIDNSIGFVKQMPSGKFVVWIARDKDTGKFYDMKEDEPKEISEEEAKELLSYSPICFSTVVKNKWWNETYEEYIERRSVDSEFHKNIKRSLK